MKQNYLLALDQSTSGTKALLINKEGQIVKKRSKPHKQFYPQAGWVEHDPNEIYENVKELIKEVLAEASVSFGEISALTITNQRETALIWDAETGQPIHRAIVWQCRRTADICEEYKSSGQEPLITSKTGLLLDPYFSATKWKWLLNLIKNQEINGQWMAGTIDSWLIWKLTGGTVHATDYTNASRTLLFNIHSLQWDLELIQLFELEELLLPEVRASDDLFGYVTDPDLVEAAGISLPICGVMGDSQAALFAQRCTEPGMGKATYGTGSSVLMNVGSEPVTGSNGLVSALAWKLKNETRYALEGIIHTSGDTIKWARDNMNLFQTFEELEQLTSSIPDTEGVYVIPAFVGLGAPYWRPNARAAIIGMNRSTTRSHVLRACLESIAYQIRDVVDLMSHETGIKLYELRADGGASKNKMLMQLQSEFLGKTVVTTKAAELSALGASYAGGLGIGFWTEENLDQIYQMEEEYFPNWKDTERESKYEGWKAAVASIMDYKMPASK